MGDLDSLSSGMAAHSHIRSAVSGAVVGVSESPEATRPGCHYLPLPNGGGSICRMGEMGTRPTASLPIARIELGSIVSTRACVWCCHCHARGICSANG